MTLFQVGGQREILTMWHVTEPHFPPLMTYLVVVSNLFY